jgi:hypothetical protein
VAIQKPGRSLVIRKQRFNFVTQFVVTRTSLGQEHWTLGRLTFQRRAIKGFDFV